MRKILEFIENHLSILLFLLLEMIALALTVKYRSQERIFYVNSSNFIANVFYDNYYKVSSYFGLAHENEILLEENVFLKNILGENKLHSSELELASLNSRFLYISGEVIKSSILSGNNYITINKGSKDGVQEDMAVVNSSGVVGIVTNVSRNYSVVLSVLNTLNRLGCRLKSSNYFGSAYWDAKNYKQLIVEGIPNHIEINKGDTIVTSGFGHIFPENILMGTVDSLWKNHQNNFYTIKMNLSVDMKSIYNVYLIKNIDQKELKDIENDTKELLE